MIQNSSVLVDLNIGVWTARKMDKQVSAEIDQNKNTRARAGNYNKNLMAGTDKLEKVTNLAAGIRNWHYIHTLPWSDNGQRLLPMANFFDYKTTLGEKRQALEDALNEFLREYQTLVTAMAFKLGDLFNPTDYPPVDVVRKKFYFNVTFSPVPDSGDFRVDIAEEYRKELDDLNAKREKQAMLDVWNRMYECLLHMSEKLSGEKKQIFRDSMVDNAVELCTVLTKLNVTNDSKLEHMRQEMEKMLIGLEAKDLRKNDSVRHATKARVDELLSMF